MITPGFYTSTTRSRLLGLYLNRNQGLLVISPSWVCFPQKSLAIACDFLNTNSLGWTPFHMGAYDSLHLPGVNELRKIWIFPGEWLHWTDYIQMDNSAKENQNEYVTSPCVTLVALHIMKKFCDYISIQKLYNCTLVAATDFLIIFRMLFVWSYIPSRLEIGCGFISCFLLRWGTL